MQRSLLALLIPGVIAGDGGLKGLDGDLNLNIPGFSFDLPGLPPNVEHEVQNEFNKMARESKKMDHMMTKMERKGIKSFSDTKEEVNSNGNLHEEEEKCVDGKCKEKVMDGKEFDPQATAREHAAVAEKAKAAKAAALAKHNAAQAAAQAEAAEKTAREAARAESRAETEAAVSAQETLPDFEDGDDFSFLAATPSLSVHNPIVVLIGFVVGSVATFVIFRVRRGTSTGEQPLLSA